MRNRIHELKGVALGPGMTMEALARAGTTDEVLRVLEAHEAAVAARKARDKEIEDTEAALKDLFKRARVAECWRSWDDEDRALHMTCLWIRYWYPPAVSGGAGVPRL